MRIECRPLSNFPGPETRHRKRAPFRVTPGRALDDLAREIGHLGGQRAIIEADFREGDIRLDGWPYANARASTPRVVLSLPDSKYGPLRYPCDTYSTWEGNVRAIALALAALRAVDRYGVTRRGEQYAGWKALPASTGPTMTVEAAAALVFWHTGPPGKVSDILASADRAKEMVRLALMMTHPDKGGQAEEFHLVQTARAVLTAHHGVSL